MLDFTVMAGPEIPIEKAGQTFYNAIYGIRDSNVQGVKGLAELCIDSIRNRNLLVVAAGPNLRIPTVTGFDLVRVEVDPTYAQDPFRQLYYMPAVVIDVPRVLSATQEGIKGDLARTLAVADQALINGFQRRLRAVYQDALHTQGRWLDETNTPEIDFDPRNNDWSALIRRLVGDARFYGDCGFDDWQEAIREYRDSGLDPNAIPLLNQLEEAVGHFLVMRTHFGPMNYLAAIQAEGRETYTTKDEDERAKGVAYALMGASVYARDITVRN